MGQWSTLSLKLTRFSDCNPFLEGRIQAARVFRFLVLFAVLRQKRAELAETG